MRTRSTIPAFIVVIILVAVIYYAYNNHYKNIPSDVNSAGEYTADAATTVRIKAAIALSSQVSALDIHVETNSSNVTLTGRVPSENYKRIAEALVRGVKGVATVTNNLQIDSSLQATSAAR